MRRCDLIACAGLIDPQAHPLRVIRLPDVQRVGRGLSDDDSVSAHSAWDRDRQRGLEVIRRTEPSGELVTIERLGGLLPIHVHARRADLEALFRHQVVEVTFS